MFDHAGLSWKGDVLNQQRDHPAHLEAQHVHFASDLTTDRWPHLTEGFLVEADSTDSRWGILHLETGVPFERSTWTYGRSSSGGCFTKGESISWDTALFRWLGHHSHGLQLMVLTRNRGKYTWQVEATKRSEVDPVYVLWIPQVFCSKNDLSGTGIYTHQLRWLISGV